jgi:hypothetical protein
MTNEDWVHKAALEVATLIPNSSGRSVEVIKGIISKNCPFKQDTIYEEYNQSAVVFLRKLLDKAAWYNSALELDYSENGEDLRDEALRIVSK